MARQSLSSHRVATASHPGVVSTTFLFILFFCFSSICFPPSRPALEQTQHPSFHPGPVVLAHHFPFLPSPPPLVPVSPMAVHPSRYQLLCQAFTRQFPSTLLPLPLCIWGLSCHIQFLRNSVFNADDFFWAEPLAPRQSIPQWWLLLRGLPLHSALFLLDSFFVLCSPANQHGGSHFVL